MCVRDLSFGWGGQVPSGFGWGVCGADCVEVDLFLGCSGDEEDEEGEEGGGGGALLIKPWMHDIDDYVLG